MQRTRRRILDALSAGAVSGPTLARKFDISRTAVWKHVEALRESGFTIESHDKGYVLEDIPSFGGDAVEFGLDVPYEVEYHDTIDSTNRRAIELAESGAEDIVILADEQTGGRGRLDRQWESPGGGIWLSLVVRPDVPTSHVPAVTLAGAVAVTRAVNAIGVDGAIKWPNDVLVGDDGHKIAGILTETRGEADRVSWIVVGIGINANVSSSDLPVDRRSTSIRNEIGAIDRRKFVQHLLEKFYRLSGDLERAVDDWIELSATLGTRVRIETPDGVVEGNAVDVEFPGALVVETEIGRVTVTAGDCEHLRPAR